MQRHNEGRLDRRPGRRSAGVPDRQPALRSGFTLRCHGRAWLSPSGEGEERPCRKQPPNTMKKGVPLPPSRLE